MSWMDRFRAPLPEVALDREARARVEARIGAARTPEEAAGSLLWALAEVVRPAAAGWRAGVRPGDDELDAELLLVAGCGCALAGGEPAWDPVARALLEHVAWGCRARFAQGPAPVLAVARRLAPDRDPAMVVVAMVGRRLGVGGPRAGEGWSRQAWLMCLAGEAVAAATGAGVAPPGRG